MKHVLSAKCTSSNKNSDDGGGHYYYFWTSRLCLAWLGGWSWGGGRSGDVGRGSSEWHWTEATSHRMPSSWWPTPLAPTLISSLVLSSHEHHFKWLCIIVLCGCTMGFFKLCISWGIFNSCRIFQWLVGSCFDRETKWCIRIQTGFGNTDLQLFSQHFLSINFGPGPVLCAGHTRVKKTAGDLPSWCLGSRGADKHTSRPEFKPWLCDLSLVSSPSHSILIYRGST